MKNLVFVLLLLTSHFVHSQCTLTGTIEITEDNGLYSGYFTSQPLCNTQGWGIYIPDTIWVHWYLYCIEDDYYEEIILTSNDTLYFNANQITVTCKVEMYQLGVGTIYLSPSASINLQGNYTECFEVVEMIDTTDSTTTVDIPSPDNCYSIIEYNGGWVQITNNCNEAGILLVFDWLNGMLLLDYIEFQGNVTYDLSNYYGKLVNVIAVYPNYSTELSINIP